MNQPSPTPGSTTVNNATNIISQEDDGTTTESTGQTAEGTPAKAERRSAVSTVKAAGGTIQVGGKGAFKPMDNLPVEYGEVPDEGEMIQIPTSPANATPVMEILDLLAAATDWNILAQPGVKDKSVWFFSAAGMRPKQILEVLKHNGIVYDFDSESKFLYIMTTDEFRSGKYGKIIKADLRVKYVEVSDMQAILQTLASESAKLISDPRTGRIIVYDTQSNIDEMKSALKRLDVPVEPRTFTLQFANANDILDSVESMLSERGVATADLRMNSVIVTDLAARLDDIGHVIAEMDRKLDTRSWSLNYLDIEEVQERLETVIPEEMSQIAIDDTTHTISLQATPERLAQVDALIKEWDIKPRQVQIEAYLVQLTSSLSRELGISWNFFTNIKGWPLALEQGNVPAKLFNADEKKGQRLVVGQFPHTYMDRFPYTTTRREDVNGNDIIDSFGGSKLATFLNYLDSTNNARILAQPRVTVYDGEEAKFENTEQKPYQEAGYSSYYGSTNSNYASVIPLTVKYLDIGTILEVTPTINSEDNVLLDIRAESSTLGDTVTTITGSGNLYGKRKSESTTTVMVKDGQTIVIGGLMYSQVDDDKQGLPLLNEIPLLGRAFRSKDNKTRAQKDLLIFIRPTIVDEYTMPESERLAKDESFMSNENRNARKGLIERTQGAVTRHRDEARISVGQTGNYYSDGQPVASDGLDAFLADAASKGAKKVVVFRDPKAPQGAIDAVEASAGKAKLKFEVDAKVYPYVPTPAPPAGSSANAESTAAAETVPLEPLSAPNEEAASPSQMPAPASTDATDTGTGEKVKEAAPVGTADSE